MTELEAVLADINATFAEFSHDTPLNMVRERLDDLFGYDNPTSDCSRERMTIGAAEAELIIASGVTPQDGAILYLHGGGFAVCSIESHRDLAERLSHDAHAAVLLLGYRLAPENPFPAGLDDAVAAYDWLLARGYTSNKLAIAGDSAGGGLTMSTLLKLKQLGRSLPACAVTLSPWVDLEMRGKSMYANASVDPIAQPDSLKVWIQSYAPEMDVRDPLLSPLNGDLTGLPPLLIQVGEREVLLDDSVRLSEVAKQAGVSVEYQYFDKQIHVFQLFAHRMAEAQQALQDVGAFIRRHLR